MNVWLNFWFIFGAEWFCLKHPNLAHFNVVANRANADVIIDRLTHCSHYLQLKESKSLRAFIGDYPGKGKALLRFLIYSHGAV